MAILKCMHELHMNVLINAIFENDATNAKKNSSTLEQVSAVSKYFSLPSTNCLLSKALLEFPHRCANFVGVESHSAPEVLYFLLLFFLTIDAHFLFAHHYLT